MQLETIPIPRDRVRSEDQFEFRVSGLHAFPGHEFAVGFSRNTQSGRWVWTLEDTVYGRFFPKGRATLGTEYLAYPYFACRFLDLEGSAEAITRSNLGRNVKLAIVPGPRGGDFHPDSDADTETRRRLLDRSPYGPAP